MIWHDDGFSRTGSVEFFRRYRKRVGLIVRVVMLDYYQDDEIRYPFRVIGEKAEIWLSGCTSGYSGVGPHCSVIVLKELGYGEPYCNWPLSKTGFELGPPGKPEVPVEPQLEVELTDAHEEVLEVIKAYHREHGRMPAIREIAELCDLSTGNTIWRRLKDLEVAGRIRREPRKARAIEII